MIITSKDNETIKHIRKLKEKKYRDEYGEYIVEGIKLINEAIKTQHKANIRLKNLKLTLFLFFIIPSNDFSN